MLEVARRIRLELKTPRFEQSDWHQVSYWSHRFGYMPSEWARFTPVERAERIATAMVEDAMELVANNADKIRPRYAPITSKDDLDKFFAEP